MHCISSKYRKPKGRPTKRSKAGSANILKRKVSEVQPNHDVSNISSETVSGSSLDTKDHSVMSTEYSLVSNSMWSNLLQKVPCSDCHLYKLNVLKHNSFGFSSKLELVCESCTKSYGYAYTSDREAPTNKFDINSKLAAAFLSFGKGHAALENFSKILGTPCMDRKTFATNLEDLFKKSEATTVEMLRVSREIVREANLDMDQSKLHDNILDITVSYDGTWHKRGHTSLYGIGIVIDVVTNLVVDFHVLSKYCHECKITAKNLGESSPEFHIWKSSHAETCQKNFDGSSASMEMHAAHILWKRSVTDCGMRYTSVLCDGDAKTFQYLNEKKVYGKDVDIKKEECVNHVSKRLGTALRNKVKEWRTKGVTLGGKKQGSLTEATIVKLQNFYRKGIVDNAPDVVKMKSSIFATLFHCMSTDAKPMHSKCPEGEFSWCFYNRAKASNKAQQMHKSMKTRLSEVVVEKIMPVYQRLASNEILQRCVSGKTQNANEALHSCIWRKCSKDVFVSKKRLELAVRTTVKEHNLGYVESLKLSNTDNSIGDYSFTIAQRFDDRRISQRKRKSSEQFKRDRNTKKREKTTLAKKMKKKEGDSYGAGKF